MGLTATDMRLISALFDEKLAPISCELEAQGNDIKAIYSLLDKKQSKSSAIRQYREL